MGNAVDEDGFITYSRRKSKESQFLHSDLDGSLENRHPPTARVDLVRSLGVVAPNVSYASALRNGLVCKPQNSVANKVTFSAEENFEVSTRDGKPALFFKDDEIMKLACPFKYALIGKFSHGRPNMQEIRDFFKSLHLQDVKSLGLIDQRHIFINLTNQEDFSKLFSKTQLTIKGKPMRILKWTPDFDVEKESPIKAVWIQFPGLRIHFMNHATLSALGDLFGNTLKVDEPTLSLSRPSLGRVLVEIDVSNQFEDLVWIGTKENGYWQKVLFENRPKYCTNCRKLGHDSKDCLRKVATGIESDSQTPAGNPPVFQGTIDVTTLEPQTKSDCLKESACLVREGQPLARECSTNLESKVLEEYGEEEEDVPIQEWYFPSLLLKKFASRELFNEAMKIAKKAHGLLSVDQEEMKLIVSEDLREVLEDFITSHPPG